MPNYVSLKEETKVFGKNNYMEVARKRLVEENASTEFILVTRGYLDADGGKRWSRFVTIPDEPEMKAWLQEALKKL